MTDSALSIRIDEADAAWAEDGTISRAQMINDSVLTLLSRVLPDIDHLSWSVFRFEITDLSANEVRFYGLPDDIEIMRSAAINAHHEIVP
jgi:hypothetical protein